MKILVCISHVPDTTAKIEFSDQDTAFDKSGVQFVINPNDEFGLTRAIWFQEKVGAAVTVINVGESDTEPTLRKALAIGADQAIRINTPPKDGLFVAKQIAHAIKGQNYDLIIAGRESIDYNGNIVPGALAALLGYNFINLCTGIEIEGNKATVLRETENGQETCLVGLPLVIGGQKGLVEEKDLKIPNMRGIMTARQKPFNVVDPMPMEAGSQIRQFEKPDPKDAVTMISQDKLDELVDILHNKLKVI